MTTAEEFESLMVNNIWAGPERAANGNRKITIVAVKLQRETKG